MKKYFIHDGLKQIGPFSITELVERGITSCTPVYSSAIGHYVTASEISLLNNALNPASGRSNRSQNRKKKINSSLLIRLGWVVGGALLIMIVSFVIFRYQPEVAGNNDNIITSTAAISADKEDLQLRSALELKEAGNPRQYLDVRSKMHKNIIGQRIIKGNITNNASAAGYKDLQMEVVFLSAGQAELGTQKFIVNGFVKPNDNISFRNVFRAPVEAEGFRLKVLSATPMF